MPTKTRKRYIGMVLTSLHWIRGGIPNETDAKIRQNLDSMTDEDIYELHRALHENAFDALQITPEQKNKNLENITHIANKYLHVADLSVS